MFIVRVDSMGRVTIPKNVMERSGITPGSMVLIEAKGYGEISIKIVSKDPSEELAEILGDIVFTREDRVRAEKLLLKGVEGNG